MVVRRDRAGALAIGQPAHAALCGTFARAWGNARFDPVVPLEEVARGAELHDVAWQERDLTPRLDSATGLPQAFTATPVTESAALWSAGPTRLLSQSRWAALLCTMHGRRLYERIDLTRRSASEVRAVRGLIDTSVARERELLAALREDPATVDQAGEAEVARASDLVWAWDGLSLALLLDWSPHGLDAVPTTLGERVELVLGPPAMLDDAVSRTLAPWPFAAAELVVRTEGRRVAGAYTSQAELDAAWPQAPWETLTVRLTPG